jgi:DNA-binding NtrC family response regulator
MIHISVHHEAAGASLIVEGTLARQWVEELEKCWQEALAAAPRQHVSVSLADVTFIDDDGKELLSRMHERGVKLTAQGLMTSAIVEEIVNASSGVEP